MTAHLDRATKRPGPSTNWVPARWMGWLAGGVTVALALALGLVAQRNEGLGPPPAVPPGVVLAMLLATPGLIGALGAWSGRRVLLVAAGILCLLQAGIAFSGVTLVFLIPALLFLRSAVSSAGGQRRPMRPARLLVIAALAAPVAVATIATTGIFGVLLLTAIGGLASALVSGSRPTGRLSAIDVITGIGVIVLVIGAWFALLGTTEEVCWVAHASPTGAITYERIPRTDSISLGEGEVAGGCDGGTHTLPGVGAASILIVGALGLSAVRANERGMSAFDD